MRTAHINTLLLGLNGFVMALVSLVDLKFLGAVLGKTYCGACDELWRCRRGFTEHDSGLNMMQLCENLKENGGTSTGRTGVANVCFEENRNGRRDNK